MSLPVWREILFGEKEKALWAIMLIMQKASHFDVQLCIQGGDQELVKLEGISHVVTTAKPEAIF
ncbi:unnamed protein product [Prunus armeniaca]